MIMYDNSSRYLVEHLQPIKHRSSNSSSCMDLFVHGLMIHVSGLVVLERLAFQKSGMQC